MTTSQLTIVMGILLVIGIFNLRHQEKKAKKKEILLLDSKNMDIDPKRCGIKGSKTKVTEIRTKYKKKEKIKIQGNIQEMIGVIVNQLSEGEGKREESFG